MQLQEYFSVVLKACGNQFYRQKKLLAYVLKQEKTELYLQNANGMGSLAS